jgi:hypothetical protein
MVPVALVPAPGRYSLPLSPRWTAVFIEPLPGYVALGLFFDGAPIEVVVDDEDARAHLAGPSGMPAAAAPPSAFVDVFATGLEAVEADPGALDGPRA